MNTGFFHEHAPSLDLVAQASRRALFGAVCVSGTLDRLDRSKLERHLPRLSKAAAELSRAVTSGVTRHEIANRRWR